MTGTPSSDTISTKLEQIAKLAREAPDMAFTTLAHHVDIDWLREAYRRTRKGGATGVDGQTAEEYAANLEGNLQSLLNRAKSGTYRAPPVRRVHILKGTGAETRPIGIPTPCADCTSSRLAFGMCDGHPAGPSSEGHDIARDLLRTRPRWPTIRRRRAPEGVDDPAASGVDGSLRTGEPAVPQRPGGPTRRSRSARTRARDSCSRGRPGPRHDGAQHSRRGDSRNRPEERP
jgi:hypothetical protein